LNIKDKISVILPVFNSEKYISESITSILKQSYRNFELIIVDDGSTDKSSLICENYAQQEHRIILIKNSHKGLTASLNDALKISSGKYIARQDSDDISLPYRLEKQLLWFLENDKRVLCGTNCKILKENNTYRNNWSIRYKNSSIIKKLSYSNCFVHSSTMFIKDKAKGIGFYDKNLIYAQDYDLWWKLSTTGLVGNLKEKLLILRDRKGSISRSKSNEQTLDFIKSCTKYFSYRKGIVALNNNKEINFYEKNNFIKNKTILLKFLYNDKLDNKIMLKNLNFRNWIQLLLYPSLLMRKIALKFRKFLR